MSKFDTPTNPRSPHGPTHPCQSKKPIHSSCSTWNIYQQSFNLNQCNVSRGTIHQQHTDSNLVFSFQSALRGIVCKTMFTAHPLTHFPLALCDQDFFPVPPLFHVEHRSNSCPGHTRRPTQNHTEQPLMYCVVDKPRGGCSTWNNPSKEITMFHVEHFTDNKHWADQEKQVKQTSKSISTAHPWKLLEGKEINENSVV